MVKARKIGDATDEGRLVRRELSVVSDKGIEKCLALCDLGICNKFCDCIRRGCSNKKQYSKAMEWVSRIGEENLSDGWIYMPSCGYCLAVDVSEEKQDAYTSRIRAYYGMKTGKRNAFALNVCGEFAIFMKSWTGYLMIDDRCPYYVSHFMVAGNF